MFGIILLFSSFIFLVLHIGVMGEIDIIIVKEFLRIDSKFEEETVQ